MTGGTSRTLKWVTGGMRSSSGDDEGSEATTPAPAEQAESPGKGWEDRLEERTGHSRRTIGLAIGAGLLFALWIGWTAYVWSERGSTAAVGVLISWPAALAAVMLVTAPFIGGAVGPPPPRRRRMRRRPTKPKRVRTRRTRTKRRTSATRTTSPTQRSPASAQA
jgi:hypothetical protein